MLCTVPGAVKRNPLSKANPLGSSSGQVTGSNSHSIRVRARWPRVPAEFPYATTRPLPPNPPAVRRRPVYFVDGERNAKFQAIRVRRNVILEWGNVPTVPQFPRNFLVPQFPGYLPERPARVSSRFWTRAKDRFGCLPGQLLTHHRHKWRRGRRDGL